MSKFDIAVTTRHRIVLHGNVLDWVWRDAQPASLTEWIWQYLVERKDIHRVVYYNHDEPPRVLYWANTPPEQAQPRLRELLSGPSDLSIPASALRVLSALLHQTGERTAVIIENAEHRLAYPSEEAVLLRQLTRDVQGNTIQQGIAIHLYTSESRIPQDFITADPDTAVILVSLPSFAERLAFFERLDRDSNIFRASLQDDQVTAEHLARATEGYRLKELAQLIEMANSQSAGTPLAEIFSRFRFGQKVDYWADQKITDIKKKLVNTVKGQMPAIRQIVEGLYRAKHRVGAMIDESTRTPAMVMFFVGATGVGKTLMARAICEAITGSEENLKRIDMSEYQREHTDQRLIGPPPGYVGHLEGGQLTNWVQEHPHSVVLIDEVEKAHERILDIFLQILEGARLTDGKGVTVDMSETILIFTSNIGTAEGIDANLDKNDRKQVDAHFRESVERFFQEDLERPEIFNRLKQGIVVFDFIRKEVAKNMIEARLQQMADRVNQRLAGRGRIHFDAQRPDDEQVIEQLLNRAEYVRYGLRDVNTILNQLVGASIAQFLDEAPAGASWRFRWNETYENVDVERDYAEQ
jgi:broad specificity phosphatase PhoE